jgi:hypothetical protein
LFAANLWVHRAEVDLLRRGGHRDREHENGEQRAFHGRSNHRTTAARRGMEHPIIWSFGYLVIW